MARFDRVEKLKPLLNTGLVYLPGTTIHKRVRYGYVGPDKPNLTPLQIIEVINANLHKSSMLPASADEGLEVPIKKLKVRPWGQGKVMLDAVLGSGPEEENYWKKQVLGESMVAVEFADRLNFYVGSKETAGVNRAIPLAVGELSVAESLRNQIEFNAPYHISVNLRPIGFVETPFTM